MQERNISNKISWTHRHTRINTHSHTLTNENAQVCLTCIRSLKQQQQKAKQYHGLTRNHVVIILIESALKYLSDIVCLCVGVW